METTTTPIKVTSLEDIYNIAGNSQITMQDILNRKIYHNKNGWVNIELSENLLNKLTWALANLYGKRTSNETKNALQIALSLPNTPQHWGLSRTVIEQGKKNTISIIYITAQHEPIEMKAIRKFLLK